jgi:hypothetical protein
MWITLTTDDVLNEGLTPQEVATLKNIQGNTDLLPGFLSGVVAEARGAIIAGGYPLGADGTVPGQLRGSVIDVVTWRWLKKFPTLKVMQTKERSDAYKAAMDRFKGVTKQDEAIERPDAEIASSPQSAVESSTGGRQASRTKLDGI